MIRELKVFEATCDICGVQEQYQSLHYRLPIGWIVKEVATGQIAGRDYIRTKHVCKVCGMDMEAVEQALGEK